MVELHPWCLFHIVRNDVRMSVNTSQYYEHAAWTTIGSCQYVCFSFTVIGADGFSFVLIVLMTVDNNYSSLHELDGASILPIADITSYRRLNLLCYSKRCSFVYISVLKVKSCAIMNDFINACFTESPWRDDMRTRIKLRGRFAFFVAITEVRDRV